jgi:hypothetical protein
MTMRARNYTGRAETDSDRGSQDAQERGATLAVEAVTAMQ